MGWLLIEKVGFGGRSEPPTFGLLAQEVNLILLLIDDSSTPQTLIFTLFWSILCPSFLAGLRA
jgi:hypothetical protein